MSENKLTTLLEIINYSSNLLKEKNIKDARLNIELMFCEVLKCDRIKLYLDFDKPLSGEEIANFKLMLKRRLSGEPLQYILGKTNFFGYTFEVNKNVLIPRQETEILVEKVLEDIDSDKRENIKILEIGTGSGCIAIALSKELSRKNIVHKIIAIDISEEALEIAVKNANRNLINNESITFIRGDFIDSVTPEGNFDYIISNPPYIPKEDITGLETEVRDYEPINALTDGKNGLLFYDKIFYFYKREISNATIFLEIGDGRRKSVVELLKKYEIVNYTFFKDYINIDRVLKIK